MCGLEAVQALKSDSKVSQTPFMYGVEIRPSRHWLLTAKVKRGSFVRIVGMESRQALTESCRLHDFVD